MSTHTKGKLIICPTPLGNLRDMSARALESLQMADVVCAEDTRVTGRLLSAFNIESPLERLDENVLAERTPALIGRILDGETIVFCTDAGMPGVSDPGLRLVAAAHEADIPIEVLPGPSAAITAYVASGTCEPHFYFGGFFPRKSAARKDLLTHVGLLSAALIFYESPNRLVSALSDIEQVLPERTLAVCRELTKLHEEVVRGSVSEVKKTFAEREHTSSIKGEIVIVIDGPSETERTKATQFTLQEARIYAGELAEAGMTGKDIANALVDRFAILRNDAYDLALEVKNANKNCRNTTTL